MDNVSRSLLRGGAKPGSGIYAGGVQDVDYVLTTSIPLSNTSTSITHPATGYIGTIWIFLAGTASKVGLFWDPDGYGAPQASGQAAYFQYTCLGDETSFSISQSNLDAGSSIAAGNNSAPRATFTVNGGVNNGRVLIVGSGAYHNDYGAAGAPANWTGSTYSTLVGNGATLIAQGANRPTGGTIVYPSDSTSYPAAAFASYGDATASYTVGGSTLTLRGSSTGGGVSYGGTNYGYASVQVPEGVTYSNQNTRPAGSQGAAILVFKNDV